jgi:exopolysaccharide biosynthesis polyprenyl glycosylphosphotransferase
VGTSLDTISSNGIPVIGEIGQLDKVITDYRIDCVFVASSAVSSEDLLRISRVCRQVGVDLKISGILPDAIAPRLSIERIGSVTAVAHKPYRMTRWRAAIKRLFDIVVGSVSFVVALPLMAVLGMAVKVTSRGPMIFRQVRVTKDGRPFTMVKFRTMVRDPEKALDGAVIDLTRPFFKLDNDPRLTRVGRFLRAFSLDELPQLWNVLRGDMSLVGPRPLPIEQVEANAAFLSPRHEVRAGMTGWWQISGRSDLVSDEALRQDVFYIENWSLALDVYVLIKTAGAVLARRGAR